MFRGFSPELARALFKTDKANNSEVLYVAGHKNEACTWVVHLLRGIGTVISKICLTLRLHGRDT